MTADAINGDGRPETPWTDADFALVIGDVSAVKSQCCPPLWGDCVNETEQGCQQLGGLFFNGATCEVPRVICPLE